MAATPVTLLFTDLVESTALLQRVGDERALRILQAHRQLLREAMASHGGREVKWLGDGLLTTFASVADGVRCAVTMAQRARRLVAGERLGLRIGLHVAEVLPDEADYVGNQVVLARRLCDRATAAQILCGSVVVELLRGRQGFEFAPVGPLELKGFPEPVAAYEVRYRPDAGAALLRHTPFTGRTAELRRLGRCLEEARTGQGGVVLLAGEPGIGKTRLIEEVTESARADGVLVLWGRCYEGEAGRPFGPFAEALSEYVRGTAPEVLRADLGVHAAVLARLVPRLGERVPDLPEPAPLEPAEERVRLLDAVAQSLLALAARVPTALVLDDLHWADAGTVALLRHVARFVPRARLLVLGAYRDVEVAADHPLTEALGTLPRETTYERLGLRGLDAAAVKQLVEEVAERAVPALWVEALTRETSGNPFFLREVLLHLQEEGALAAADGNAAAPGTENLLLPDTVRQVVARRLVRMPETTTQLLRVAAAFTGGIDFEVARRVADLEELAALDALDAALGAQLLVATGGQKPAYDFTHALMRHTLYEGLSPARQARLHRQIAEAMEAVYGERAVDHAAAIARHYRRSASLPGAKRGLPHFLAAADQAERKAAFDEVVEHLGGALDLVPATANEAAQLLGRLGLALLWALRFDEAGAVAGNAATRLAEAVSPRAAADYLAEFFTTLSMAGGQNYEGAGRLVRQGLAYAGGRHDTTWAVLTATDSIVRETDDPGGVGLSLDTPERREVAAIFESSGAPTGAPWSPPLWASRGDILARDVTPAGNFLVGDYRGGLPLFRQDAEESERQGRIANAVYSWAHVSIFHVALGEFAAAEEARRRAAELAVRLIEPSVQIVSLLGAYDDWRLAMDEGWVENSGPGIGPGRVLAFHRAVVGASLARENARLGRAEVALRHLAAVIPAIEQSPAWAQTYPRVVCDAAETLWLTERTDHIDIIERNLREKVVGPDFRFPMMDGRLALGRLRALQHRYDEARDWFAKARAVLDEQGARPLRAIVDYDEALMFVRRGAAGDAERARPLVDTALAQFRTLGMPGWIRRAEALLKIRATGGAEPKAHSP